MKKTINQTIDSNYVLPITNGSVNNKNMIGFEIEINLAI